MPCKCGLNRTDIIRGFSSHFEILGCFSKIKDRGPEITLAWIHYRQPSPRSYSLACLAAISSFLFLLQPFQSCPPLVFPWTLLLRMPWSVFLLVSRKLFILQGLPHGRPPGNTLSLDKGVDVILHFKKYISPALSPGPNTHLGSINVCWVSEWDL